MFKCMEIQPEESHLASADNVSTSVLQSSPKKSVKLHDVGMSAIEKRLLIILIRQVLF